MQFHSLSPSSRDKFSGLSRQSTAVPRAVGGPLFASAFRPAAAAAVSPPRFADSSSLLRPDDAVNSSFCRSALAVNLRSRILLSGSIGDLTRTRFRTFRVPASVHSSSGSSGMSCSLPLGRSPATSDGRVDCARRMFAFVQGSLFFKQMRCIFLSQ